jgi:hypothetical protein
MPGTAGVQSPAPPIPHRPAHSARPGDLVAPRRRPERTRVRSRPTGLSRTLWWASPHPRCFRPHDTRLRIPGTGGHSIGPAVRRLHMAAGVWNLHTRAERCSDENTDKPRAKRCRARRLRAALRLGIRFRRPAKVRETRLILRNRSLAAVEGAPLPGAAVPNAPRHGGVFRALAPNRTRGAAMMGALP